MINKTKWYKGKCAYSIACRTPKFPSKLRSLFVNKYDDTIRKKFQQRIDEMAKSENCICGSGKNRSDCCEDLSNDSIVEQLLVKLTWVDGLIRSEAVKRSVTPICKKGCNDCCHEYFYISLVEYLAIRYTLIKQNIFNAAVDKAKLQEKLLSKSNAEEYKKLYDLSVSKSTVGMFTDNEYISRFEMCPCNIDGECIAYNARPFICRAFGATYQFDMCDIIYKKVKNLFSKNANKRKADKYIVPLEFDMDFIQQDSDVFEYKGKSIVLRPYPLMYWLCNDKDYVHLYDAAIHGTKGSFTNLLMR